MVSKQYMEVRGSKMEYMSVNERVKKVEGRLKPELNHDLLNLLRDLLPTAM